MGWLIGDFMARLTLVISGFKSVDILLNQFTVLPTKYIALDSYFLVLIEQVLPRVSSLVLMVSF